MIVRDHAPKLSKFLSDANFVIHADRINARGAGTVGGGNAQSQPIGGHRLDPVYAAAKIVAGFCSHLSSAKSPIVDSCGICLSVLVMQAAENRFGNDA